MTTNAQRETLHRYWCLIQKLPEDRFHLVMAYIDDPNKTPEKFEAFKSQLDITQMLTATNIVEHLLKRDPLWTMDFGVWKMTPVPTPVPTPTVVTPVQSPVPTESETESESSSWCVEKDNVETESTEKETSPPVVIPEILASDEPVSNFPHRTPNIPLFDLMKLKGGGIGYMAQSSTIALLDASEASYFGPVTNDVLCRVATQEEREFFLDKYQPPEMKPGCVYSFKNIYTDRRMNNIYVAEAEENDKVKLVDMDSWWSSSPLRVTDIIKNGYLYGWQQSSVKFQFEFLQRLLKCKLFLAASKLAPVVYKNTLSALADEVVEEVIRQTATRGSYHTYVGTTKSIKFTIERGAYWSPSALDEQVSGALKKYLGVQRAFVTFDPNEGSSSDTKYTVSVAR